MIAEFEFHITMSSEDTWNYSMLFSSKTEKNISKEDINPILMKAVSIINNDKNISKNFAINDYHFYQSDDFNETYSLNVETDILEFTKNKLVGDCYAYEAESNKFIAKLFFQYELE